MLLVDLEAKASAIKEKNAVKAEVREFSELIALVRRHLVVCQNWGVSWLFLQFERKLVSIMNKKADKENQAYKKMIVEAKAYDAAVCYL